VLCEVFRADGTPHPTNTRARLRRVLEAGAATDEPWIGFEQAYTWLKGDKPLAFPEDGDPAPQGPYYCGVGADVVFGRSVVEAHTRACIDAGIMLYGINAEVFPGPWECQIGSRGITGESPDPLSVSDHLCLARYLLWRIAEGVGVVPTFAAKPVKGDWNGAGMHANFSTRRMREVEAGLQAMPRAIKALGATHDEHIAVYGDGLAERLTGLHETCALHEFRAGVADCGTSVRIPRPVAVRGYGYLEDRRPAASADPYLGSARMLETGCGGAAQAERHGSARAHSTHLQALRPTANEYISALKGAGFRIIRFEDVTSDYSTFVNNRFTTYLQKDKSEQFEELIQFFRAMDTLYRRGDGESSRLGGCRVYLEK
jgi:glutamine synthetase